MILARSLAPRGALLALGLALLACDRPAPPPGASTTGSPPVAPASSPAGLASGSGAPAGPAAAPGAKLAPMEALKPACCRPDRVEGFFGPEKGINARYSGDYFHAKNGTDRILFPEDLISDTQELYLFAKSAGKALYQERRLRVVGESPAALSVEVDDRGETGTTKPFSHSKCQTVDPRRGRKLAVADLASKDEAPALLTRAQAAFEASPGHEQYRFVPASFALVGAPPTKIRFCNPKRDEGSGDARLDIELAWTQGR